MSQEIRRVRGQHLDPNGGDDGTRADEGDRDCRSVGGDRALDWQYTRNRIVSRKTLIRLHIRRWHVGMAKHDGYTASGRCAPRR